MHVLPITLRYGLSRQFANTSCGSGRRLELWCLEPAHVEPGLERLVFRPDPNGWRCCVPFPAAVVWSGQTAAPATTAESTNNTQHCQWSLVTVSPSCQNSLYAARPMTSMSRSRHGRSAHTGGSTSSASERSWWYCSCNDAASPRWRAIRTISWLTRKLR